jgi:hypothetical protein
VGLVVGQVHVFPEFAAAEGVEDLALAATAAGAVLAGSVVAVGLGVMLILFMWGVVPLSTRQQRQALGSREPGGHDRCVPQQSRHHIQRHQPPQNLGREGPRSTFPSTMVTW